MYFNFFMKHNTFQNLFGKLLTVFVAGIFATAVFIEQASAQDWANLNRYRKANEALKTARIPGMLSDGRSGQIKRDNSPINTPRDPVVFMGNSITDNWVKFRPEFFAENGYIGRGISGQTTPQMLVRFRQDVVNIGAGTVVILAGTNDIAGNTGPSTLDMIVDNIASMCEIARSNGIRVILCSVLPAKQYSWKKEVRPDTLIPQLNNLLQQYAAAQRIPYIDFFSVLADTQTPGNENGLPLKYSKDGVHPNAEGYKIMEEVLLKELQRNSTKNRNAPRLGKQSKEDTLRLMSYNVRNCKGMDGKVDFNRIAAVISQLQPDVAAIEELDSMTNRYGGKYVLGELATRTNMYATYAPAISFGGGKYGIGILSKEQPIRYRVAALPGREEKRTLLMAEFSSCIFCCTHLSLTKADRIASLEIIKREIDIFRKEAGSPAASRTGEKQQSRQLEKYERAKDREPTGRQRKTSIPEPGQQKPEQQKPVFIAGDWNDTPDSEILQQLQKDFTILTDPSVHTFPADIPNRTLDYIAVLNSSVQKKTDTETNTKTETKISTKTETTRYGKIKKENNLKSAVTNKKSYRVTNTSVPVATIESDHRPVCCEVVLQYNKPHRLKQNH